MDISKIKSILSYNYNSGKFTWTVQRGSVCAGQHAGYLGSSGYWQIKVMGRLVLAHRLAWLYARGEWPSEQLDHIDGNPLNNSISNLRECTSAQNHQNRKARSGSTSSHVGVCWEEGRARWRADIKISGVPKYLGRLKDESSAIAAYVAAKRELHSFNPEVRC